VVATREAAGWLCRLRWVHSGLMGFRHRANVPLVDPDACVASTAVLSGQVRVGPGSCVLHGAVLSADGGAVETGAHCVIMEHAVLRGTPRHPLTIGNHVLAGPHSCLTGCTIGDEVFIATGAMVFNGAQMGRTTVGSEGGPVADALVWCPAKRSGLPVDGGRGNRGGSGLKM
jgi:carbonic anhydrase/acetyltransferase-like protein (isoleucine patch superfamily)